MAKERCIILILSFGLVLALVGAAYLATSMFFSQSQTLAMPATQTADRAQTPRKRQATTPLREADARLGPNTEVINLNAQRLGAGTRGNITIDVALPEGYHLNAEAPQSYKVSVEYGARNIALGDGGQTLERTAKDLQIPVRLPLRADAKGTAELRIHLKLYYCRTDDAGGACRIKNLVWYAPVEVTPDANAPHDITAQSSIIIG